MNEPALASLIREVLAEELARLKNVAGEPQARVISERIRIANSDDLNRFAQRVLALASDPEKQKSIQDGKHVFELAGSDTPRANPANSSRGSGHGNIQTIEKGFVSERQIDRLPKDISRLMLGKAARITPLARDRARQRGITIERMDS